MFIAFIHNCQHRQANKIPFSCWGSVPKSCMTATPWTMACQAPLSFTISQSLFKFTSIKSVMLSNHLIFCHPHLLLPSIFPSIRVFFNESTLRIRWPKVLELQLQHQSFQWLFRVDFLWDWLVWGPRMSKGLSRVFSTKVLELQFQHQSFQWIFRVDFL